MKILVIGASGMAGHMITTYLKEQHHDVATLSGHHPYDQNTTIIDITDTKALTTYLNTHSFDTVINCVGLLIKAAEKDPAKAILINAYFPHFLSSFYAQTQTKVIHLSTDCVFSGEKGPYTENSIYDGTLFYDRTKALGELINSKDLTFRMSIIGPDRSPSGVGLLNWFLQQQDTLYGYRKVYWNGITTLALAKAIDAALTKPLTGLYHLVPKEPITKYDLLNLFQQTFSTPVTILPCDTPATNKVLLNTRTDFTHEVPPYPEMLQDLSLWIKAHPDFYPHYHLPD